MNNDDLLNEFDRRFIKKVSENNCAHCCMSFSDLPVNVVEMVSALDDKSRCAFFNTYNRKKIDKNFGQLFAVLSVHYAYMGKLLLQLIFWLTIGGAGIWYLYDLLTIQKKVLCENEFIALEALDEVKGL